MIAGSRALFDQLVYKVLTEQLETTMREILASPDWKVKVDKDLQRTVGAGLQKVLGFDPSAIEAMTARIAAENRAALLGSILGNILGAKFNDGALQSMVTQAFMDAARTS